ncbi:hypothetical protein VTI74DRAFT_2968 [Chaetomium olivicolor]
MASAVPFQNVTPTALAASDDENSGARQFAQQVSEEEIYEESRSHFVPYFTYPPTRPLVFVKWGDRGDVDRQAEADMQRRAWDWVRREREARRCSQGIHIPEVYKSFTWHERDFIIMELVDATLLSKSVFARPMDSLHRVGECYNLIAEAIQLLRRMPVPQDATPGPYTQDVTLRRIQHPIFKDQKAVIAYRNIDELELHINRVIQKTVRRGHPRDGPLVHLERELIFCYCDLNDENFMFTKDDKGQLRLYLIDFEQASFLPASFLAYAILRYKQWWTAPRIAERIVDTLPKDNLDALELAQYAFRTFWWGVGLKKKDGGGWHLAP